MVGRHHRLNGPESENVKVKFAQSCLILCDPGQNTGVGSLFLLQGIFPTQDMSLDSRRQ